MRLPSRLLSVGLTVLFTTPASSAGPVKPVVFEAGLLPQRPLSGFIFDYDGTLADRGRDGASLPISAQVLDGLNALLRSGLPVAIVTGRSFDMDTPVGRREMGVWAPLLSKIPADLRRNLFFSGSFGGEFVSFDVAGRVETFERNDWNRSEKAAIRESVAAAAATAGVSPSDLTVYEAPGQLMTAFARGDSRTAAFSAALSDQFSRRGLSYPVRGRDWIYTAKSDKEPGSRRVYEAMRARGFPVSESNLLIVGDDFRVPGGSDAPMARAFPRALVVTVGDRSASRIADGVKRSPKLGAAATLGLIRRALKRLAP